MNAIVVSTHKRPFHTRLCLESIARAQAWSGGWADLIAVGLSASGDPSIPMVAAASGFQIWIENGPMDAHQASKCLLDGAFSIGADFTLYVEDDVIFSPDAFLLLKAVQQERAWNALWECVIGVCLYHETIPEHYTAQGRSPDPHLLHLSNGLNTCGGTGFFRAPYLKYLSPQWNCKTVEPKGFDYSAHFLMYVHKLYMVYPDFSRSANTGYGGGSIQQEMWARYFGRSLWVQTKDAQRTLGVFTMNPEHRFTLPTPVREEWMEEELRVRGVGKVNVNCDYDLFTAEENNAAVNKEKL